MARFYCRKYGCTITSENPEADCLRRQFALVSPRAQQYPFCAEGCKQGLDIRKAHPALAAEIQAASGQLCKDKQFKRNLLSLDGGLAVTREEEEVEEYA